MTNQLAPPPTLRGPQPALPPISSGVYWYLQCDPSEKEEVIKQIAANARELAKTLYVAMKDMISGKNAPPAERLVRYETMARMGTLEALRQAVPMEYDELMKDWHQLLSRRAA